MTTEAQTLETLPSTPFAGATNPFERFKFDADMIAAFRRRNGALVGRWLVLLSHYGEEIWCAHERPPGVTEGPSIVILHPEAGPSIAATAPGVIVNFARRKSDYMVVGHRPDEGTIKGLHPVSACGYIESAWCVAQGVAGVIALWRQSPQDWLVELKQLEALEAAQICLGFSATYTVSRAPSGLPVIAVTAGDVYSAEFQSLTHALGARVIRRLALDEDPDRDEPIPRGRPILPRRWAGLTPDDPPGQGRPIPRIESLLSQAFARDRGGDQRSERAQTNHYNVTIDPTPGRPPGPLARADLTGGVSGVGTANVVTDAVHRIHRASASSAQVTTTTAEVLLDSMSLTLNTTGGPLLITFTAGFMQIRNTSTTTAGPKAGEWKLKRDGTQLALGSLGLYLPPETGINNNSLVAPAAVTIPDQPAAGTYTYTVAWNLVAGVTAASLTTGDRSLSIVEYKAAS